MIAATYLLSGGLLIVSRILFQQEVLNAFTQTLAWWFGRYAPAS